MICECVRARARERVCVCIMHGNKGILDAYHEPVYIEM